MMFEIKIILIIITISLITKSSSQKDFPIVYEILPKMVVFDVENTLWPEWNENNVKPPFTKSRYFDVLDSQGIVVKYHTSAVRIMTFLHRKNISMTGISRCDRLYVKQLIELFQWDKYIDCPPIITGTLLKKTNKLNQLNKIALDKNILYEDMLYFSDAESVREAKKLGVLSVIVKNGMKMMSMYYGLERYAFKNKVF